MHFSNLLDCIGPLTYYSIGGLRRLWGQGPFTLPPGALGTLYPVGGTEWTANFLSDFGTVFFFVMEYQTNLQAE